MAIEVVWLDQAKDDVKDFLAYLYPKNSSAALLYIDDLESVCAGLADFPRQGYQYNERYRAIVVHNHLIFYRYDETQNEVTIVSLIDGRRDLPTVLKDLE